MKTAEEILNFYSPIRFWDKFPETKKEVKQAMLEYGRQVVDECVEVASAYVDNGNEPTVNKQSILNIKDQLK